jgi:uncharacterized protein (TIGR03067 family)
MAKSCVLVTLLVGLSSVVAIAAGADEEKIQGSWRLVEAFHDGKPLPAREREGVWMEFRNGVLTVHSKGKAPIKGTYTMKPDRTPRHLDLVLPGDDGPKDVIRAIYQLDGDKLKVCQAFGSDDKRPTEFASSKQALLMTLKKQKKQNPPKTHERKAQPK